MSTNQLQPGDVLDLTAPTGGVIKGVPVVIGAQLVVPTETVAQTLPFRGHTIGVWSMPKAPSQAWAEGAAVYWDVTNSRFSTTATVGFFRAGVAVEAVAGGAGDTTGKVRLTGEVTFAVSATYVQR
jgi:predicted RecA/RadA family phage recombinase